MIFYKTVKEKCKTGEKGMILVMILAFAALMSISMVTFTGILKRDMELIQHAEFSGQAKSLAEAGIEHAFAKIKNNGTSAIANFSETMDTGTYSVVFSSPFTVDASTSKYLATSTGTVGNTSISVTAEVRAASASALTYQCAAGNDIWAASLLAACRFTGDVHANHDVYLKGIIGLLGVVGRLSACNVVKEGSKLHLADGGFFTNWDLLVWVNGENRDAGAVFEGVAPITFPVFNYDAYKQEAIDSDDYYVPAVAGTPVIFNGVTLSPENGIVYVDGDVRITGNCVINGGLIADNIQIGYLSGFTYTHGSLTQNWTDHNRNVIIAKMGDIKILGQLDAEKALVYAMRDVLSLQGGGDGRLNVTGSLLAQRDINFWSVLAIILYTYAATYPADMVLDVSFMR